jgi:hypothetical protein
MARRRHNSYRSPPADIIDHRAFFIDSARKIVLSAGFLDAYRHGAHLILRTNLTKKAQDELDLMIKFSESKFERITGVAGAWEHSGRMAMQAYLPTWWTTELCYQPPAALKAGEEFYGKYTIADIVHRDRKWTPDRVGPDRVGGKY